VNEPRKRRRIIGADPAVWALVQTSTRRLAVKTVETLQAQRHVSKLVDDYQAMGKPQLAGHLFELMHALSFNPRRRSQGLAPTGPGYDVVREPNRAGGPSDRRRRSGGR
jgi:hypothetical protein